jgi:hypothetical protein
MRFAWSTTPFQFHAFSGPECNAVATGQFLSTLLTRKSVVHLTEACSLLPFWCTFPSTPTAHARLLRITRWARRRYSTCLDCFILNLNHAAGAKVL